MARRKSVFTKWTLALIVVIFCPFVCSRPQEVLSQAPIVSSSVSSVEKDKPTENPIRYRYNNDKSLSLAKHTPVVTSQAQFMQSSNNVVNRYLKPNESTTENVNDNSFLHYTSIIELTTNKSRRNRLVSAIYTNDPRISNKKGNKETHKIGPQNNIDLKVDSHGSKKSPIRKVITKWTDNAKIDGLAFSYETTTSEENNDFTNDQSTEVSEKIFQLQDVKKLYNIIYKKNKPKPQHNEVHIYSDNIYVTDRYFQTTTMSPYQFPTTFASPTYSSNIRPTYVFPTPTPTPIITNIGNPKPWNRPNNNFNSHHHNIVTTQKPVKPVKKPIKHQNNPYHTYSNYDDSNFEVSTFQPTNAYTDRIVIRPEEYSASPDECPTIFLTLNNTFQGQAKEACPDLNIAVNTNVINKNVVIESEEEGDAIFPGGFDIPFGDESGDEEEHTTYDSDENQEQTESSSIEGQELTNYNSDLVDQSDLSEPVGSSSNHAAAIHKPGKPSFDEDDIFSPFSSVLQFFKPALSALNWLATINPFTFGLFSILLSPVMFIFAGTSGVAALFAPWAFSGREANKIEHVYRPHWYWDNELKTWNLHTDASDRIWVHRYSRNNRENENETNSVQPTLFYKIKELMKSTIRVLTDRSRNKKANINYRKNKRKKRETWTIRIK